MAAMAAGEMILDLPLLSNSKSKITIEDPVPKEADTCGRRHGRARASSSYADPPERAVVDRGEVLHELGLWLDKRQHV